MPVILDRSDWVAWLDMELVATEHLLALIRPFPEDTMQAWGVSHAVNRVANDEPKLLQPIA
jgi:putative SOS response-associated peptidase YedK